MDRNFYYQNRAKEYQREISRELATRSLLKDGKREPLNANQAKGLVLRVAPAVIVMTILLVSFLR
jgi:hypothetical protein